MEFFGKLIEKSPQWIAAISFAAILLNVVYEAGFFFAVGPEFQLLLSPIDYLQTSLRWMPATILALLFDGVGIMALRAFGISSNNRAIRNNRSIRIRALASIYLLCAILFIVPIALYVMVLGELFFSLLMFSIVALWAALFTWLATDTRVPKLVPRSYYNLAFVGGALVIIIWFLGAQQGEVLLNYPGTVYELDTTKNNTVRGFILSTLIKGIVLRDVLSHKISFYKWEEIERLSVHEPQLDSEPWGCRWLQWRCARQIIEP